MFKDLEEAKINLDPDRGTNPSYACAELIASIAEFGIKHGWYCKREEINNGKNNNEKTIFNIIEIAVTANRGINEYDWLYLIRVAENIKWMG